jgi:hypothetical protein
MAPCNLKRDVDRLRPEGEERDMAETTQQREGHHPGPPDGKVIGAVAPASVETVRAALVAAGFPADRIDVVNSEELEHIEKEHMHNGVVGLLERFVLSIGEDLSAMEELRAAALDGAVLIGVPVAEDDDAKHRVAQILHEHEAHVVTHFGRWTITSL